MLYELGKCLGPCVQGVDEGQYRKIIDELTDFLSGNDEKLLKDMGQRISRAVSSWNFEEAQTLKERYTAIRGMVEKQHVHEHFGKNRDIWAFSEDERKVTIVLLTFRRGVLISRRLFKEPFFADTQDEAITTFLFQYYSTQPIPDELILSEDVADMDYLEKHLEERKKGPLKILGPKHRSSKDMVRLAIENLHGTEPVAIDEAFRRTLSLRAIPSRIEIYDISHIHGKNPTGAMVVFEDFKPAKKAYRVFHIRGTSTMDDVAMIDEVLKRRVKDLSLGPLPDLFIIDGGKGQLAAAKSVLKGSGIDKDVISIAKGERRKRMEDIIYIPARKNPLILSKASPVFKEIVKMRDEAHRFAISSHRRWKTREDLR
jgi:excinuclease ABC subunit C